METPGYKVIKAELRDGKGKLICSHKDNPMHLWSYSPSFKGYVSYSELKQKILVDFERPKAIYFTLEINIGFGTLFGDFP